MGARFSFLPPCPLAPCPQEVVGTQMHTHLFISIWEWGLVSWEWGEWQEQLGIEGSDLGVRGASFSLLPPCPLAPYTPEVVGIPTHTLAIGSKLGASWSELEQAGSELEWVVRLERAGSKLGVSWSKGSELGGWREFGVREVPGTQGCSGSKGSKLGVSWRLPEALGRS